MPWRVVEIALHARFKWNTVNRLQMSLQSSVRHLYRGATAIQQRQQEKKCPIIRRPCLLVISTSRQGLDALLSHIDVDNRERIVLDTSRAHSSAERSCGISKPECLGVVWAMKQLHPHLLGKRFKVSTDHFALQGLIHYF